MRPGRVLSICIVVFLAGMLMGIALGHGESRRSSDKSNNDISVNACVEKGGIPIFDSYSRDNEERMMIDCRFNHLLYRR